MSPNGYHMAGEKTEEGTATLCWQQDTLVELQDLDQKKKDFFHALRTIVDLSNKTISQLTKIQQTKIVITKNKLSRLITKHKIQVGSKFNTAASK